MRINPLIIALFFLSYAVSVIFIESAREWELHLVLLILVLGSVLPKLRGIIGRLKPVILFLPLMMIFYIGFSYWLTPLTISELLISGSLALGRMVFLMTIMAIWLEITHPGRVLQALRSLWSRLGLPWRKIEDGFLFLELTLRFFPTFRMEWTHLQQSRKALGLQTSRGNRWRQIREMAGDLPGMFVHLFRRADETAQVMGNRGYGRVIPRGVADPIPFTAWDILWLAVIIALFAGVRFLAQI